jgi:hypothetical protein
LADDYFVGGLVGVGDVYVYFRGHCDAIIYILMGDEGGSGF